MTYSITISGHSDTPEKEKANLEAAQSLVETLDGPTSANFSGQSVGSVNIMPPGNEGSPPEEAADTSPMQEGEE